MLTRSFNHGPPVLTIQLFADASTKQTKYTTPNQTCQPPIQLGVNSRFGSTGVCMHAGGLKYSSVIDKHLVSAFVPFLPLERAHVKMCIRNNATPKHITLNEQEMNAIADELEYFPPDAQVLSSSGCKRVDEKVNLYRNRRRRHEL